MSQEAMLLLKQRIASVDSLLKSNQTFSTENEKLKKENMTKDEAIKALENTIEVYKKEADNSNKLYKRETIQTNEKIQQLELDLSTKLEAIEQLRKRIKELETDQIGKDQKIQRFQIRI